MNHYMGIDIGTSGCKAVIFDENGKQVSFVISGSLIIEVRKVFC